MTLSDLLKRSGKLIADNSPTILTVIGVTGTLTTAFLTGKASLKAADDIFYAERGSFGNTKHRVLEPRDKVKLVWKHYIPAALTGAATVATIIAANRVGSRRAAALAAAYSLSEKAYERYRDKVVETIGEKKSQLIYDAVAKDQVTANPPGTEVIVASGKVLCCDSYSGRYFDSEIETLRKAQNDTNMQIINDSCASLTDFYYRIGLTPTAVSDEVGWNLDRQMELKFSYVGTDDGRPCVLVNYSVVPVRNYHRFS